jgi:hypothetical protein
MSKIKHSFSLKGFLFLGILCSLPAFLFSYNHVLNMFYEYGCPLEDQGLCAYAMWRNQFNVQLPPSIGAVWGEAFFSGHLALILSATSLLSKVIDISMINFYAYYHGISHGLLAFSMFFVFYKLYKLTSTSEISIAFFLSFVFSFNGISVASMYYPHYEMLAIPVVIFFSPF